MPAITWLSGWLLGWLEELYVIQTLALLLALVPRRLDCLFTLSPVHQFSFYVGIVLADEISEHLVISIDIESAILFTFGCGVLL